MLAILLFSHGSVVCGASRCLGAHAREMESRGDAPIVEAGFLNYVEPDFQSAVDRCLERGATRIVIAPFFLVAGKFVRNELPPHIEEAQRRHPGVEIVVAEALRDHPALAEAILAAAETGQDPARFMNVRSQTEGYCRQDSRCPWFGTPECPATEPTV